MWDDHVKEDAYAVAGHRSITPYTIHNNLVSRAGLEQPSDGGVADGTEISVERRRCVEPNLAAGARAANCQPKPSRRHRTMMAVCERAARLKSREGIMVAAS